MAWVTTCPSLPGRVLAYACWPGLIINSALLKTVLVWSVNACSSYLRKKHGHSFQETYPSFPRPSAEICSEKEVSLDSEPHYFYRNTFFSPTKQISLVSWDSLFSVLCKEFYPHQNVFAFHNFIPMRSNKGEVRKVT